MTGVSTYASISTLTADRSVWNKDCLLQLICQLASPFQLSVVLSDAAAAPSPTGLSWQWESVILTQRNAIVRALCGFGLHYALDQEPYYLLGGHGAIATHRGGMGATQSALAIGGLTSWMSVAAHMRTNASEDTSEKQTSFLQDINAHLEAHAFLVPASQPTVADMDVALALVQHSDHSQVVLSSSLQKTYPSLYRWFQTTVYYLRMYTSFTKDVVLPESLSSLAPVIHTIPPVFYNGTEDASTVFQPKEQQQQSQQSKKSAPSDSSKPSKAKASKDSAAAPQSDNAKTPAEKETKQQEQTSSKKKSKEAKAPPPAETDEVVDISALDIRVGKIVKIWPHAEADKLFCEEIDLGADQGIRQIASGLRPFYQAEDLQDQLVLVLCNLKKRNLVGFASHGMVLCASNADHTAVEIVSPPHTTPLGERVVFGTCAGEPAPENKVAKKKLFEALAPDLQTDATGQVVWKEHVATTSTGVVKASKGMPNAHVS
jgi:aminoacyl tRNA synthase complex-interacting multifunctional protein 1